jgi:hypothetical protein
MYMRISGLFVTLEACHGWNDNIHNDSQLVKVGSNLSKKLILDRIEDLSSECSSIIGQENPGSEKGNLSQEYPSRVSDSGLSGMQI